MQGWVFEANYVVHGLSGTHRVAGLPATVALNAAQVFAHRGLVIVNMSFGKGSRRAGPLRAEAAGLNISNVNTQRLHLLREALTNSLQREFRGIVNAYARERLQPADAGNIEHVAAALLAQVRQHRPQHVQRPKHVHIELPLHFLGRHLLDAAQRAVASVIHNHIELAEMSDGIGHSLLHLGLVGYLAHEAPAAGTGFLTKCFGLFFFAKGSRHFIAFFKQQVGQRGPETRRDAGNKPDFGSRHEKKIVKLEMRIRRARADKCSGRACSGGPAARAKPAADPPKRTNAG